MSELTARGTPRKRQYPATRAKPGTPRIDRIVQNISEDAETGCWVWQQRPDDKGYGRLTIDGKSGYYAHRVAFEEFVGPIPVGLQLDHLCRNTTCCNPAHLEPVTCQVNVLRGIAFSSKNARKTHCPHGHGYDENAYVTPENRRACRVCRKVYMAHYNALTPSERQDRKRQGLPVVDLAAYFAAERQKDAA